MTTEHGQQRGQHGQRAGDGDADHDDGTDRHPAEQRVPGQEQPGQRRHDGQA
jgi:hypothetical protein